MGRFILSAVNGLQAAAYVLGLVGSLEENKAYHGADDEVGPYIDRQEQGQENGGCIENGNERDTSNHLDITDAEIPNNRKPTPPAEGKQNPKRECAEIPDNR